MRRVAAAVLAGYVLIGILVVLTDQVYSALNPRLGIITAPPLSYFLVSLATDSLYTVLGGYVCCWIARSHCRTATIGLIILGEIMGLLSLILFWKTAPHWYGLALLIVFPPMVLLGSKLRTRYHLHEH